MIELKSEPVNVRQFGTTTPDIAAAIATAGVGGSVYFPRGVYEFTDHDGDGIGLIQLSGQKWFGEGTLRLSASTTAINVAIQTADFAEDYSFDGLTIDGNRSNIAPAANLYNTFYLLRGPRGGKRGAYRNLRLANSWGRVLQTSNESVAEYAENILVENVHVTNAGTKGISVTQSKRVTVQGCFVDVNPYAAVDHIGAATAASGSCFEVNDSQDVILTGNHGTQVGASIIAPGFRVINGSASVKVIGNTIKAASYLAFVQNCDDVEVASNIGRNIRGNAILIADADTSQPNDTCKRIRVHDNTIIDPTGAYVFITANKSGFNAYVEAYISQNDFIKTAAGTPTHGIYNAGVAAPAIGGECLVYQWQNNFSASIPNKLAGAAAAQIQGAPL